MDDSHSLPMLKKFHIKPRTNMKFIVERLYDSYNSYFRHLITNVFDLTLNNNLKERYLHD